MHNRNTVLERGTLLLAAAALPLRTSRACLTRPVASGERMDIFRTTLRGATTDLSRRAVTGVPRGP
jgi:hypothetical protein